MSAKQGLKRKVDEGGLIDPEDNAPEQKKNKGVKDESLTTKPSINDAELENGYVDRRYYPAEMDNSRCARYIANEIERPIETLTKALSDTRNSRDKIASGSAVVHWFKADLRTQDNKALHLASQLAKSAGVPLICIYIISPQDFEAHVTSVSRVDFILRSLKVLQADLAEKDIPLYVETVEKRKRTPERILTLCKDWGAKHLFANLEYEVDELRREASLVRQGIEAGISMDFVHDTCVVAPGLLRSGTGNQYAVYTPWYRAWLTFTRNHPSQLELFPAPERNPATARTSDTLRPLFSHPIPTEGPPNKRFASSEDKTRFSALWPAGEHEARARLDRFVAERIEGYQATRNFPAQNTTSIISVHLAAGTLSARTAVHAAQSANTGKRLDGGKEGIATWISEVAWRDFYKHVLVNWPHVCMNKAYKAEYTTIEWEYNREQFDAFKQGKTGYPYIDAALRQMNTMGYMHNRARMGVASFLAKHLMIDWRWGERYFMEQLIDGDFASNSGGWGFSASCGVDPQPYFRIFNPLMQSTKFDPDGEYIRAWVPELKDVKGKAVHDPWADAKASAIVKKSGYPRMCVDHKEARARALDRYKAALKKDV